VNPDDLDTVHFTLLLRWRSGQLTAFTGVYVRRILFDQWRKTRPELLPPESDLPGSQLNPAQVAEVTDLARAVREALDTGGQLVFDTWLEEDGSGWRSHLAEQVGKSPSWVTTRAKKIERLLTAKHGIRDVAAFFAVLRQLQPTEEEEPGSANCEDGAEVEEEPASPSRAEVLRDRLLACRAATDLADIDGDAALDSLHAIYVQLGKQLRAEEEKRTSEEIGPASDGPE
jgi:hypothetical protein